MSKVNNKTALERAIHRAYHYLALKHKVDVDKVSEIIGDYQSWERTNLVRPAVKKVPSKSGNYGLMIRVLVPATFFWNHDGTYDGVEFGEFPENTSRHQFRLLDKVLTALGHKQDRMREQQEPEEDIPPGILKAFDEKGDNASCAES